MNSTILRSYKLERANGNRADFSLRSARMHWEYVFGQHADSVRIRVEPDESCQSYDDLLGDSYNPKVNPDIPRARLMREEKAEMDRINRLGVYGIIGEYTLDGETWIQADSCWGFIGDDWKGSGYDIDIMLSTLKALESELGNMGSL